jgi:hypothetical protein
MSVTIQYTRWMQVKFNNYLQILSQEYSIDVLYMYEGLTTVYLYQLSSEK